MKYTTIPTTDIRVSTICLGTMNWGEQNSEAEAHEQLDYAVEQGVTFIDTAEVYPIPPRPESAHRTEEYIGRWLSARGKRDDVVIASKVAGPNAFNTYLRPDSDRLSFDEKNIRYAIEGTLKRLKVDYIDLYQLHWPQRETNYFGKRGYEHNPDMDGTTLEQTLGVMQQLVKEGKVRHVGLSNETPWGVNECLRLHREKKLPRVVTIQNPYSLIMREYEIGLAEIGLREDVGLLVYSPLSMGVLTGKYLDGSYPKGSRFDYYGERNRDRYNPPHAQEAIKKYVDLAHKHGLDPAALAIAFTLAQPFVTSSIIGATSMDQLRIDILSVDVELTDEVRSDIAQIFADHPNPIG